MPILRLGEIRVDVVTLFKQNACAEFKLEVGKQWLHMHIHVHETHRMVQAGWVALIRSEIRSNGESHNTSCNEYNGNSNTVAEL